MKAFCATLLVAASAVGAGCTPPPDYLFVDPHVQPVRVELRKSFGILHKHYEPVPLTDCGFFSKTSADEGAASVYSQEVWRVVSLAPGAAVLSVQYGVVPPGFVQATPPAGPAPPLETGHPYSVECSGDTIGMGQFEVPALVTRPAPPLRRCE